MLTDEWRQEALRRFPELQDRAEDWETSYMLWFDLTDAFKAAYLEPRNEDLIRRIYAYSQWCCDQPQGTTAKDDLGTCVAACFYEHIPESPEAMADMPRWFSRSDVLLMKPIFSYMVGEEGFRRILMQYDQKSATTPPGRGQGKSKRPVP